MISTMNLEANMNAALKYAEQICYSSKKVLEFTYAQSKKYCNGDSVFVEAGVAAGAQIIAMRAGCPTKKIYAIDSFCGLPLPSNKDNQMPGIKFLSKQEQLALPNPGEQLLESTGAVSVCVGDFENHIINVFGNTNNIYPIVGWFEETLPTFECEPISLLRLDGDLYNSTYVCLKYLYPKVIKGGLVIIDDWALPGCRQACVDYFMENGIVDFKYHWISMYFIKDKNSEVAYWYKK